MSLGSTRSRLMALTRDMMVQWEGTREVWTDAKRDEFERDYLQVLLAATDRASSALEQLDELLMKVRKDCE